MKNIAIAVALIAATPSVGHAERWEKVVTVYGWVPGLDTSVSTAFGDFNPSSSGSDLLSSLDMVFMGAFEAHKGRWGFVKEIIYVDLSESQVTPFGTLFSTGRTEVEMLAASGYVTYELSETSVARYEIAAGIRYFDLDTRVSLSAGTLPGQSNTLDSSWYDPVIGLRGNWQISEKWSASGFADYGSFKDSSETWQVLGTLNYQVSDRLSARFGYRHMDISKKVNGADVDIGLSGPIFGITYRF